MQAGDVLCVESGCLIVGAPETRSGTSAIAMLLFEGDQLSGRCIPPLPLLCVTAQVPSVVSWRRIAKSGAENAADYSAADEAKASAGLALRSALHAVALIELTAEQRIATLLVELVLKLGQWTPGGCVFDMPLGRVEIARYLALNPDTVSRIMSRLKSSQLIVSLAKRRARVRNFEELAALSPLAPALLRLSPDATCGQPVGPIRARLPSAVAGKP